MVAEQTARERGAWIEPVLAALSLAVVFTLHPLEHSTLRLLDLVICLGAAVSGMAPRSGALISGVSLLSYLFFPANLVSVAGLTVFINIFAAFRRGLPERLPITIVLGVAVYLTLVRHSYGGTPEEPAATVMLVLLLSIALGAGHGWHQSRRRLAVERVGAEERVATMRVELARDLHDTVAQTLSHAAMRAHMASMHPDATPELTAELELIAADCSSSSQDLRQLLRNLREHDQGEGPVGGPLADVESLTAVVADQADRLRAEGLQPRVSVEIGPVSAARATTLSKIAVEATSNMIKHAPTGSECVIQITEDCDNLVAYFGNPGTGRPLGRKGLGLVGIEERAALLGGRCAIERDGRTWGLRVWLPHGYEARDQELRPRAATGSPELRPPTAQAESR
ncbi:sensor histidine kinase [Tessaracoccus flavus]|jgi:signal transduction histidine kinase|uniref:histidine kinase n=1 Tax=Tessaracoccus flavus TaxID=1610493 RepID=A0A1Q2CDG0_9ACTN|nr:histidine kinase [Tessaracoccus flavus]AQP44144.1 hypothetical protein RPIT_04380 [Tessaracoccus flavus]SDY36421.1 Signal transduction histidine kinase [Tessaracoccus flavus]